MPDSESQHRSGKSGWIRKFGNAFRGIRLAITTQNSFRVHLPVAAAVIALAAYFRVDAVRWSILLLCIGIVISAELFNTGIESLARAITTETNPHIRSALDIASGAVLITALTATAIGLIILLPQIAAALH